MSVPFIFSNAPGGTSIPLAELDANFAYLAGSPTFTNLTLTGNLTVGGTSTFNSMATFNAGTTLNGGITVNGQTQSPTGFTGTGLWVLNNGPTLIAPDLGTPASGILTNCTGLPVLTGISGLGNGVADFLAVPSSYNLHEAMLDETGSGQLVFNTNPILSGVMLNGANTVPGTLSVTGNTTVNNLIINGAISIDGQTVNPTGITGTGLLVLNNGPTLIAPNLGTPASGVLTNCTGYPASALTGIVPIANGGTSASTAPVAINNLLPSQTGNQNRFITTDGTAASWGNATIVVVNIAALKAITPLADQVVSVSGYYTHGDGGGGLFYGVVGGVYTDNGGTVIVPSSGNTTAWIRIVNEQLTVKMFGAKGDGVNDDTAEIQSAINRYATGKGLIYFPPGTYKVTSTVTIANNGVSLVGAGEYATVIQFAPTADGSCFLLKSPATRITGCSISDMTFYSTDATYAKVAIECYDISNTKISRISISGNVVAVPGSNFWSGGVGGSIGIWTRGRELSAFTNLFIYADRPIVMGQNLVFPAIDADHFHFQDCTLAASNYPCITVLDENMQLTNITFDGYQSWNVGTHGFYWNDTTANQISSNITFQNVRSEQGLVPAAYTIYLNSGYSIDCVLIQGCQLDVARNGVYARKIYNLTLANTFYSGGAGRTALDVDATVSGLRLDNTFWQVGATANMTGQTLLWGDRPILSNLPLPYNAVYTNNTVPYYLTNAPNAGQTITLASGASQTLATDQLSGVLFITNSEFLSAVYSIDGTQHNVFVMTFPYGQYSNIAGNVGTTNIFWDGGSSRYVIQNNTAGALRYKYSVNGTFGGF